ncbi:MAG: rRNA maturation RNAse YbeY, partial [Acetatifactor sp.]|nr:rRNA maturation RNAse YbeY [Acetatifactor sp.]
MTFYVENETETSYDFSVEQTVRDVAEAVLAAERCPYEVQVNVLLTDNVGIREFNRQYRQIDRETDVLS